LVLNLSNSQRQALALESAMGSFRDIAAEADTLTAQLNADLKENKEQQQEIVQFAGQNTVLAKELRKLEADSVQLKINQNSAVQKLLENFRHVKGVGELIAQLDKERNALVLEKNNIENDTLRIAEATFKEKQREAKLREKILGVQREQFRIQQQEQATQDSAVVREAGRNPFFEFVDEGKMKLDQQIAALQAQIKFEEESQTIINGMKQAMISAEYALLRAQLEAEASKIEGTDSEGAAKLRGLATELSTTEATALQNVENASAAKIGSLKEKLLGLKDAKADLTDVNQLVNVAGNSLSNNMVSAFDSLIQGTKSAKQAFGDMAKAILVDIAKMIAKLLVQKAVMSAMNMIVPGSGAIPVSPPTARRGGMFESYSAGGIARGREAGYPAILHGTEAVVPLPNGNSIPVEMKNEGQSVNNVTVNVSTDGQTQSSSNGPMAEGLGQVIAAAVQKELHNQKRAGGILNKHGAA